MENTMREETACEDAPSHVDSCPDQPHVHVDRGFGDEGEWTGEDVGELLAALETIAHALRPNLEIDGDGSPSSVWLDHLPRIVAAATAAGPVRCDDMPDDECCNQGSFAHQQCADEGRCCCCEQPFTSQHEFAPHGAALCSRCGCVERSGFHKASAAQVPAQADG